MKIIFSLILILFFISCRNKAKSSSKEVLIELTSPSDFFLFSKVDSVNPVLRADSSQFTCPILGRKIYWAEKDVFNPAAVIRNDTLFLLYRAEDKVGKYAGTSRIGLAWSLDGFHFTKKETPVFYPDNDPFKKLEWEGGCEDPRIVQDETGTYFMTYTAYDGDKARMMVASSINLIQWTKHGHVFANTDSGNYVNIWSKSGSIVCKYESGTPVAVKINGKYWMYGGDVNIWVATSDDLINWKPVLYHEGEKPSIPFHRNAAEIAAFKIVFGPRNKKFDSDLVEPGPPAMLTASGIWLIYNSRNIRSVGDTSLPEGTYAAGYVMLDKNDPTRVIQRSDNYFIKPEKSYEITGQVNNVCFLEGLVKYKGKWFLYYGTADSKIAVAIK